MYDKTLKRLKELETTKPEDAKNRASLRLKILIKNMFDDKSRGWVKSKDDEKKIQTKDEVAKQVMKKDEEKRKQELGG